MAKMLTRLRAVAAKIEAAEGVAESLSASDASFDVYEPRFNPNVPYFKRDPARSSLSPLPGLPGPKAGAITFGVEVKGSGAAATAPGFSKLLRACGMIEIDPWKLSKPGGDWSGAFTAGERVTQATSGAIGIVMFATAATEDLWVIPVSGTFDNTNTVTGAESSSAGIPSAAAQSVAIGWRPGSGSTVPSLTIGGYFDGIRHVLRGARGNVTLAAVRGEVVRLNFEFTGIYDPTTDVALISASPDSTIPPVALGMALKLQGGYDAIFQQLSINLQNQVVERENASKAVGIESFLITGRAPQMTVDPEQELVATHDFYGKLRAGTQGRMEFQVADPTPVAGNRFRIGAPATQYVQVSDDDRTAKSVAGLTMDLTSKDTAGNDELVLLSY